MNQETKQTTTVSETRDILLVLSFYLEHGGALQKEAQKLFDDIANDKIVLVKKGE